MIAWLAVGLALAQDPEPQPEPAPSADPPATETESSESPDPDAPDPRDAEMFGAPDRDAERFGAPDRDDERFGAPDRDDEMFGASDRDDDMFGAPDGPKESVPPAPTADPGLSGPTRTDGDIARRLGLADARFVVGGFAYLRLDGAVAEGDDASTVAVSSPNLVDLFGDARPNDRLRLFVRGRVRHDPTVRAGDVDRFGQDRVGTTVALDQLWLNLDVAHRVFVTAGRQRLKWGVGRLWNPTDFLAPSALDGLAVFDERLGVGLVKVHVPIASSNTNVYAIAELEGARHLDEIGGALRVEQLLGPVEVALSGAAQKGRTQDLGAQISLPVWLLDLKAEVAVRHGVRAPRWEGRFDLERGRLPREVDRSDAWIPQALAGAELGVRYSDEDTVYLGAEYFYNGLGYDDATLYPWLIAQGQYVPFYTGRHYAAGYVLLPGLGRSDDHTITATVLANASDGTLVARGDWSVRALTELTVNVYGQVHGGPAGGEFAFALDVPPIPGVLPDGLAVARPLFDAGVGAQLRF